METVVVWYEIFPIIIKNMKYIHPSLRINDFVEATIPFQL